jgi:hypothetical protein
MRVIKVCERIMNLINVKEVISMMMQVLCYFHG